MQNFNIQQRQIRYSKSAKNLQRYISNGKGQRQSISSIKDIFVRENIDHHNQIYQIELRVCNLLTKLQQKSKISHENQQQLIKNIQFLIEQTKMWEICRSEEKAQVDIDSIRSSHQHQANKLINQIGRKNRQASQSILKINQTIQKIIILLASQKRETIVSYSQEQNPYALLNYQQQTKINPSFYIQQGLANINQQLNSAATQYLQKYAKLQERVQQIQLTIIQNLKIQRTNRQKQYSVMIQLIEKIIQKSKK